jgi:type IV secretion system protein VirB8
MAKKDESNVFSEGETWDTSTNRRSLKSETRAWVLFWMMFLIAALAVSAVAALAPLKSVETFVVRVDNATGIVDVIHGEGESGEESNYNEAIDKHFVARYLRHRENYSAGEFQENYRITSLSPCHTYCFDTHYL